MNRFTQFAAIVAVAAAPCLCFAQLIESKPTVPSLKPLSPQVQQLYKEANQSYKAKNYSEAVGKLQAAQKQAEQAPKDDLFREGREVWAGGKLMEAQALLKRGQDADLAKSLEIFTEIGKSDKLATARQRAVAQMNAATVHMRLKQPDEAVKLMYECDWDQIERSQRPVLFFNYGRALEESGKPEEAIIRYARSLANDREYQPAAARLQRITLQLAQEDDKKIVPLGESLIREGAASNAATFAVGMLMKELSPAQERAAIQVLLRAWTNDYVTQERFEEDYGTILAKLLDSPRKPLAEEVRLATNPEFTLILKEASHVGINLTFPWCLSFEREPIRGDFALFVAATARPYLEAMGEDDLLAPKSRSIQQAFLRVYAAWLINPLDFDLCQQLAWLTHDFRAQVDPKGDVRTRLIGRMFSEKGNLYLLEGKTLQDWEKILRLHTSLGQIFDADKKWGDEKTVDSSIAQWTFAINAEKQIRELKPESDYRAPGLHEHLARCLTAKQRLQEAFDHYIEAGNGYLARKNVTFARRMADSAREIEPVAGRAKLSRLLADIDQASASLPKK